MSLVSENFRKRNPMNGEAAFLLTLREKKMLDGMNQFLGGLGMIFWRKDGSIRTRSRLGLDSPQELINITFEVTADLRLERLEIPLCGEQVAIDERQPTVGRLVFQDIRHTHEKRLE